MSITIDYFFNYDRSLPQLAEEINLQMGCLLTPYQRSRDDYFCRLLGMEFDLDTHTLINDGELDFETYRFQIGIRTAFPEADFRPIQLSVMACAVYALHLRLGITGILVFDVQRLLARYHVKPGPNQESYLFDEVSNEFVQFPKHINDLMTRMPHNSLGPAWEEPTIKLLESEGKRIEIPGKNNV